MLGIILSPQHFAAIITMLLRGPPCSPMLVPSVLQDDKDL